MPMPIVFLMGFLVGVAMAVIATVAVFRCHCAQCAKEHDHEQRIHDNE